MTATIGYLGAVTAILFFGTNYIPTKKYPTYDGMIFQWFMCSGILCVGLAWGLYSNDWSHVAERGMYTYPEGIVGGALFAVANMLIPTIVNTVGLGMGFMVWNGSNIVTSYMVSRFGFFGVAVSPTAHSIWTEMGIVLMLCSIGVFGMIRPRVQEEETPLHMTRQASEEEALMRRDSFSLLLDGEFPSVGFFELAKKMPGETFRVNRRDQLKWFGIILAIIVGCILGNSLTPYVLWIQSCRVNANESNGILSDCNPLDFLFSQTIGIYVASTVAFLIYSTFHKFANRSMPRSALRPAYISGLMWGIGLAGQLVAAGNLGYTQAYPLTSIGPAMVSVLWSYFYFHEIQGQRNTLLMAIACGLVIVGVYFQIP